MQTDLASPLEGKDLKNDVVLKAGDIVVVPMSGIAKVGVFVQQYLRDINPHVRHLYHQSGQCLPACLPRPYLRRR